MQMRGKADDMSPLMNLSQKAYAFWFRPVPSSFAAELGAHLMCN